MAKKLTAIILGLWMVFVFGCVEASPQTGFDKPAISVLSIMGQESGLNEQAAASLMSTLGQLRSVRTVERSRLPQLFSEKRLTDSGIVQALSNRSMQAIGIDYGIIGDLSMYTNYILIGGSYQLQYTAVLQVRLVDAQHQVGQVLWSAQDQSTSLNDNGVGAINEACYDVVRKLYEQRFPIKGTVIAVKGTDIYVDLDATDGVEKKDVLFVKSGEQVIYHPKTGEQITIGNNSAELRIREIQDGYCIAELKNGSRIGVGASVQKRICGKPRILGLRWSGKVDF